MDLGRVVPGGGGGLQCKVECDSIEAVSENGSVGSEMKSSRSWPVL